MQKTKLGISVGLFGATIYFIGLINFLTLVIVAGYVLLFESNEWLRKAAIKAVAIVIGFYFLSILISLGNDVFNVFNAFLSWFDTYFQFHYPFGIETILRNIFNILEKLILIVLALKAFKQESIKVNVIDNVINKHL